MELDWSSCLDGWTKEKENYWIECETCKDVNPITDFNFYPTWAFGELGFTFWNWGETAKESFIKELEILTGLEVTIVEGRV